MGIHHETIGLAPDAPAEPARRGRATPLRHWLLLAGALVALGAPLLVTSTAAATAFVRPIPGATLEAVAGHDLSDAAATLALALGLLGLVAMGRRPRTLDAARSR